MTTPVADALADDDRLLYPDSDGKPIADNTLQFQWIVTIQGNLDGQYRHDPNVFVAGDLLWYPVRGQPAICLAPDVMVAFGRPKGRRGSYKQWVEAGIAPQVVFEILSPNNTDDEMNGKMDFYEEHGVEEYYIYDPDDAVLKGYWRQDGGLREIMAMDGWVSPQLQIRFDMSGPELVLWGKDNKRFLTFAELVAVQEQATARAEQAEARAELLAARLRQLGIEPPE